MTIEVAELFAGVGGFRLGLERAGGFETVWANQWEPPGSDARQFAWRCYEAHFGRGSCVNRDIEEVLAEAESGALDIPDVDGLCAGFPCQDYSVAKPSSRARGIEGRKGGLWWGIYRFLKLKRPVFALLENVDRLLKSPVSQRGRDFAVILSCLHELGYCAEWRVLNAADYGMPQKRRRVFILAYRPGSGLGGTLDAAFPCKLPDGPGGQVARAADVSGEPWEVAAAFAADSPKASIWQVSGSMSADGAVATCKVLPVYDGPAVTLGDLRVPDSEVPEAFFIDPRDLPRWERQRAAKMVERTTAAGYTYTYSEGAMAWPDPLDKPARTILTGEGGKAASRMKHAVYAEDGRIRRLVPDELDMIQTFPRGWTAAGGLSDSQRAFCMGNALVVGIVERIGAEVARRLGTGAADRREPGCS